MTTTLHTDSPIVIAKEARKAIRAAFPGVKFSLTNSRGTGYGWIHLSWTDGPTSREMDEFIAPFDARLGGYTHINTYRNYSPEAEAWAAQQLVEHPGRWDNDYDHDGSTYYAQRKCLAQHSF